MSTSTSVFVIALILSVCAGIPTNKGGAGVSVQRNREETVIPTLRNSANGKPDCSRLRADEASPILPLPGHPCLPHQEDDAIQVDLKLGVVDRETSEDSNLKSTAEPDTSTSTTQEPDPESPEEPNFAKCLECSKKELLCKDKFCGPVCTESNKKANLSETTTNCFVYCDVICGEEYDDCSMKFC